MESNLRCACTSLLMNRIVASSTPKYVSMGGSADDYILTLWAKTAEK